MEEINITPFGEREARQLTEEIKNNFNTLGERVLEAYRRRAWEVLGYQNFTSYTEAEFGLSRSESYRLKLNTLTTLSLLPELGKAAHEIPYSQKELLHKLPSEQRTEGFREAQQLAKDKGREKPTAKDLKQVVAAKLGEPSTKSPGVSQSPKGSQEDTSNNLTELLKKLRQKIEELEITLQALDRVRTEAREKTRQLEKKVQTLNTVLEALDRVRAEASLLRDENKQLKKLLNSLGGT